MSTDRQLPCRTPLMHSFETVGSSPSLATMVSYSLGSRGTSIIIRIEGWVWRASKIKENQPLSFSAILLSYSYSSSYAEKIRGLSA
jgi:hypothetical protein